MIGGVTLTSMACRKIYPHAFRSVCRPTLRRTIDRFVELFESVNDLKYELPDRHGAGVNREIGNFPIHGFTRFKQGA